MRIEQMLRPTRFLRRQDLGHHELQLRIARVSLEQLGTGANDAAWVMGFDASDKLVLLESATIERLRAAFGADVDCWVGRRVILYVDASVLALRPARSERAALQHKLALEDPCGEPRATTSRTASVVQFPHRRRSPP